MQVLNEYEDVLNRPESMNDLRLDRSAIDAVIRFLAYISMPVTPSYLFRPNLRDEKDNIFVELAVTGNAEYLITSNIKDFTVSSNLVFDDVQVVTPSQFMEKWRHLLAGFRDTGVIDLKKRSLMILMR